MFTDPIKWLQVSNGWSSGNDENPITCQFSSCSPRPDVKTEYTRMLLRMESGDAQMISPRTGLRFNFLLLHVQRDAQ